MELVNELIQNSKPKDWKDGAEWLLYSMVGGLMPVWAGLLMFKLLKLQISLGTFTDNGEFALYSASYLTGIIYILFKDFKSLKNNKFPNGRLVGIIVLFLLLASSFMFGLVCSMSALGKSSMPQLLNIIDKEFLRYSCLSCFVMTLGIAFFIVVADNMKANPDIRKMAGDQLDTLGKQFDDLK